MEEIKNIFKFAKFMIHLLKMKSKRYFLNVALQTVDLRKAKKMVIKSEIV